MAHTCHLSAGEMESRESRVQGKPGLSSSNLVSKLSAVEIGQRVKALAAKPNDLNLIPGNNMVERTDSLKVSPDFHP